MIHDEIAWVLQRITVFRWFLFLFVVGVLIRYWRPPADGVPFRDWLRLRGRNLVMMYGLRPLTTKMDALVIAFLAPTLAGHGLLYHLGLPSLWHTVIGLVLLDFSFYVRHRLDHGVPILWRIHRVHHSDPCIDVTTSSFSHPLSAPLRTVWQGVAIALLGVPATAAFIFLFVEGYLGYLHHVGFTVEPLDRVLRCCGIVSPENHRAHHARDLPVTDSNFGSIFSIWDRLFGTYRSIPAAQIRCGLPGFDTPGAQTIPALVLSPLRNLEAVDVPSGVAVRPVGQGVWRAFSIRAACQIDQIGD